MKINKILKCKIVFGNSRVNTIVNAIRIIKYGYMIKKTLNYTELKLKLTFYNFQLLSAHQRTRVSEYM